MMKKLSIALLLIVSVLGIQAQNFPGQPRVTINGSHNPTIPCGGGGCYNASATKQRTGVTDTYTVDSIPFFLFPTTGAVIVPSTSDDVWSNTINLPFTFCFFGTPYTQIVIGSNGIVSFNTTYAGGYCPWQLNVSPQSNPLPNSNLPLASIMGPYQDIYPPGGGNITYQILGQAPRRVFVVSYNGVAQYSCTSINSTNQIVLYEGTNIVETYITSKVTCSTWNGGLAIEGIQNSTGTQAYAVPGRNNTSWTATNSAHRFTPSGNATQVTTTAWHQLGSAAVLSTTDSALLCPPSNSTTQYVVDVTYYQCDPGRTVVVSDTMSILVAQSAGSDQYLSCLSAGGSVVMGATGTGTWAAVPGNPSTTVITNPTSPTTSISGFGTTGDYYFTWTSPFCVDTAVVHVSTRPDAGPDKATCVSGAATMAAIGTGTWAALPGNPAPTTIVNPSSPTTSITGFSVGGTYGFTWNFATCADTAYVVVPVFTVSATGDTSLCKYQTTTIAASAGPSLLGPFSYLWLDSTLVQSPHAATTAINSLQNSNGFVVKVTAANGCVLYDTVHVGLSGVAPQITITPSAADVCPGDVVNLNTTILVSNLVNCGTLVDTTPDNALLSSGSVGAGASTTTTVTTPYSGAYRKAKFQYLITAAEMNAAGLSSGAITDLSFFVSQLNSSAGYDSFSISLGCTSATALSGNFSNSLLEVLPPTHVYPNAGWSPHPFLHYFNWDGVSNLIVQICYTMPSGTSTDAVAYTATTGNTVAYSRSTASGNGCDITAVPTFSSNRPNMRFGIVAPNVLQYQWSPPTGDCDTCASVSVTVNRDTTYQLFVNDNGCSNTGSVHLTVNPYVSLIGAPDASLCNGAGSAQLSVAMANPPAAPCLPEYFVTSVPYSSISGTQINIPNTSFLSTTGAVNHDDGTAGPFNLNFSFPFYCNNYSQIWVNSNGWISLTNPYPATTATIQRTPQTFPPVAADRNPLHEIALMVGDYDVTSTGQVSYFISGTAPNRVFVVKFNALQYWANPANTTTGEIHMYEGSGVIEIMLQSSNYSSTHTTGIKDDTNVGVAPPFRNNQTYTISSPEGWRFTPHSGPSAFIQGVVWTPNGGTLNNDTIINPVASPTTNTTYVADVAIAINKFTTPEVCHVRDTVNVRVSTFNHTLTATPSIACVGSSSQLSFSSTDSVTSYVWTPGAPALSSATISNPVATVYDTTKFYVTATDTNHCVVKDSITVLTYPVQHPSIGRDTTICYTDSVVLRLPGAYTFYEWYIPGNSTPVATTPSVTALPVSAYVVRLQDAASGCFFYSDTVHVDSFAHPRLGVAASGPLTFCVGGNVVLSADQLYSNYMWSNSSTQQVLPVTTDGSYSYTATDAHNCVRYSDTVRVVVDTTPRITYDRFKPNFCAYAADTIVVSTGRNDTIIWSLSGTIVAYGDTLITTTPGTYNVRATKGCPTDSIFTITVSQAPVIDTLRDTSICSCTPAYVVLANANSAQSPVTYAWSNGTTTSQLNVNALGSSTYRLTVTDATGCSASADVNVSINCFEVHAYATEDTAIRGTSFGLLDSPVHAGPIRYSWTPADSLSDPTAAVTKATTLGQQSIDTFYLAAYDSSTGCSATSSVIIYVVDRGGIAMPNAFTPNGDNLNETYFPVVAPGTTLTQFRIYNRWGQTVYDNPHAPWDGSFGGNAQGSDTYTYFVTVESPDPSDPSRTITRSIQGSFQLFR